MTSNIVATTLRLPEWLDERLKSESRYNAISKNAYILEILRKQLAIDVEHKKKGECL